MPLRSIERPTPSAANVRQLRYRTDADFRESARAQSRKAYRRRTNMELSSCIYSLDFIDDAAQLCRVACPNGSYIECKCFSISGAAEMLQLLYQTIWRWVKNSVIPKPILKRDEYPRDVYHLEEVRILVEEIGKHAQNVRYLRRDHTEVRERIEQRFAEFRSTLLGN